MSENRSQLSRRHFLGSTAAAGFGLALSGRAAAKERGPQNPPNILFILSDQYRRDCVGVYGNDRIETPNLDQMAADGVALDTAYVTQPVCSPCRSSIFTGLYPHSSGVWENNVPLPESSRTLSERLAPLGYDCGFFGKWHLVRRDCFKTMPEYPNDGRGDNHYFGKGADRRYAVDVLCDDTIEFIKRPRKGPFYAVMSVYPPHPPYSAPQEYVERYSDIEDHDKRVYYAMCTKVDEAVGRLLKTLEETGVAENTLVIFTTEHGHFFHHRWNDHNKRLCYDTASRIPLIARMPGVIDPGRHKEGLFSSVDLVPTMMALIGQRPPADVEGVDLSTMLINGAGNRRDYIAIENIPYPYKPEKGQERCVRNIRYKLILSTVRPPEMYDMHTDPGEVHNIWSDPDMAKHAERLVYYMADWARKTQDKLAPQLLAALEIPG